jgi:hypothetical protein
MRLADQVFDIIAEPVVTPGRAVILIHSLLNNSPAAVTRKHKTTIADTTKATKKVVIKSVINISYPFQNSLLIVSENPIIRT